MLVGQRVKFTGEVISIETPEVECALSGNEMAFGLTATWTSDVQTLTCMWQPSGTSKSPVETIASSASFAACETICFESSVLMYVLIGDLLVSLRAKLILCVLSLFLMPKFGLACVVYSSGVLHCAFSVATVCRKHV